MTGTPAIRLHEVSFRYADEGPDVLHDVSLSVPRNTITAVLGPNGSGKTTLLHLLLGLRSPTTGTVELDGEDATSWSRAARSRYLGLVPQEESISFPLAVEEFVLLGRAPHLGLLDRPGPQDRALTAQALEDVGVARLRHRSVLALSGGERQLVTVARALVQQARVVLMDEPTSHLDLGNRQRILALLEQIRRQQRAVVFTTHDPNAALEVADRAILVREGRVLSAGPTEQVMDADRLSRTFDVEVEIACIGRRRVAVVGAPTDPT